MLNRPMRTKKILFMIIISLTFSLFVSIALWIYMWPPLPKDSVLILEYHQIAPVAEVDRDSRAYNVEPQEFAAQLDYLTAAGYHTITMQEYMRSRKGKFMLPDKPVILTFDDGYADNYTYMLPLVEERGMKAVVYMITNKIGAREYLTWDQLRDMQKRGVEIGSHTANHLPLTSLPPDKQKEEVALSKLLMEWNGINTVFSLSYPNGAYDASLPVLLREEEYLNAVTGDPGLNTTETNPYLLKRINIPAPRFGLTEFKFRLFKAELFYNLGL